MEVNVGELVERGVSWLAFLVARVAQAGLPYRWVMALGIVAAAPSDGALSALVFKFAAASPDTLVSAVLDWPFVLFALVAAVGVDWSKGYLESIRRAGGIERDAPEPKRIESAPPAGAGGSDATR
jgi:hypothetical protein